MMRIDGLVRLVASDMDGTLLDDQKRFPPDFAQIIGALREKGIRFAAASGRSYATLRHDFSLVLGEKTAGRMDYICDNGAFVVEDGRPVDIHVMDRGTLREIILVCQRLPEVALLLCGIHGTYHLPYSPAFYGKFNAYQINHREVEVLTDVEDDIFKVAVCDLKGPENNVYPVLERQLGGRVELQVSGRLWMDVMNPGVGKGAALGMLQRRLGITSAQTMAFGDFCNDIGLLERAEYSFAMANAHPQALCKGRYLAGSNNEHGVTVALRRFLLEGAVLEGENPAFEGDRS